MTPKFLILDGYNQKSRHQFRDVGMELAWELYRDMLLACLPEAGFDVILPSDPGVELPTGKNLASYTGVLWTGCNLTVYHDHNPVVCNMIQLAEEAYETGIPSFGSCWGLQIAAVAAGGKVEAHPRGREMNMGRKIALTDQGRNHPMYKGKPIVFDGFESHDDIVTVPPPGGVVLAGNEWAPIQAMAVKHKKGVFWATQYHTEYTLRAVARLIVAREEKLTAQKFFSGHQDVLDYVAKMEALAADPSRKDLRWQLGMDDDILDDNRRRIEFANWLDHVALDQANLTRKSR